ncbi:MAG: mucoidy inhibitor MuiA family protein [Saprospiraceae bacterium]|nr:mucoidy inhibitor MuiA family protein [Saprospiraceae bacterium]
MKKRILILLSLISCLIIANAQEAKETPVTSSIERVTVFLQNAQIIRKASVQIPVGESKLIFKGLSPYMDAASVRVKAEGDFVVLSVNHDFGKEEKQQKVEKAQDKALIDSIRMKIDEFKDSLAFDNALLASLNEEEAFLKENKAISGKDTGYKVTDLESINVYYANRIKKIKFELLLINKRKLSYEKKITELETTWRNLTNKQYKKTSEVVVTVSSKAAVTGNFELSYFCGNAGWFPSYDLKVVDIASPVELIYKANIRQSTEEDWNNIKLVFSNANPTASGNLPTLYPYYLNFNARSRPGYAAIPGIGRNVPVVKGIVTDKNGEPLIGATILIKGTSVGTVTDVGGSFSINVPAGATEISVFYTGYNNYETPISGSFMQIVMEEGVALEEVVVTGYAEGVQTTRARDRKVTMPPTTLVENQTSVEFALDIPFTVKSDGKIRTLELTQYDIPAFYEYQAVPKLEKDVFLTAKIYDWAQYNILEGEANLFFEDTYLGKSLLDVRFLSDTLNIYLGRDQSILVQRENLKEFNKQSFLGGKQSESRSYKIIVRNNKKQQINLIVKDQVPVTQNKEIEVSIEERSSGQQDENSGEVVWKLKIPPGEQQELIISYTVKYPKEKYVWVN